VVGQKLPAQQRGALLTFLGASSTTRVSSPDLDGRLAQVVALLLDSIYHALR
jgi:hypothetical protein